MLIDRKIKGKPLGYRVVIITLDSHAAGPCDRAASRLVKEFPELRIEVHAAAEWGESVESLRAAKEAVEAGDIIIVNLLFLEEHVQAILPSLMARRDHCDAIGGVISDGQIIKLTKMGSLDMSAPQSGAMKLLKKIKGADKQSSDSGEKRMRMLKRLPKILKYIPGKAQDLRAWFMLMQYWLGGSDDNIESMIRFLLSRYSSIKKWQGCDAPLPLEYPEVGLYHPNIKEKIFIDIDQLPRIKKPPWRNCPLS